jgi:hypothetical protein
MEASQSDTSRFDTWTRRRFGLAAGGALTILLGLTRQQRAAAKQAKAQAKAQLAPIGNSGVSGFVTLHQLHQAQGTAIVVHAKGLTPGTDYVSLYYDNPTCELEPYSEDDVIGEYAPNPAGIGQTHGEADDDLDEIHSVSVRRADDFTLVACAAI